MHHSLLTGDSQECARVWTTEFLLGRYTGSEPGAASPKRDRDRIRVSSRQEIPGIVP